MDPIDELVARLQDVERDARPLLVAIDGRGGAGKSTLAEGLAARLDDAVVVPVDDFGDAELFPWWDRARFRRDVLDPILAARPARYRPNDWEHGGLGAWRDVGLPRVLILEGVASLHPDLDVAWDLAVWVECPREVRLARGIARDGEGARSQWEDVWMPAEERYIAEHRPDLRADVTIAGTEPTSRRRNGCTDRHV